MSPTATPALPETPARWRALRREGGLGVGQVARRAGIDRTTVWKLESGQPVSDRVQRLVALALGLDLMPDHLFEDAE